MNNQIISPYFLVLGLFLLCSAANAENDRLTIEADTIRYDSETGSSIFEGDVLITRSGLEIKADTVEHTKNDQDSGFITANGQPVQFTYQPPEGGSMTRGSADRAVFYLDDEEIRMIGGAVISYEQTTLRAHGLSFNLQTGERRTFNEKNSSDSEGSRQKTTIVIDDN